MSLPMHFRSSESLYAEIEDRHERIQDHERTIGDLRAELVRRHDALTVEEVSAIISGKEA